MKNLIAIIVFLLAGFLSASYLGTWWDIAVIGFLVSFVFGMSPGKGFGYLFIGGMLLWGGLTVAPHLLTDSTLVSDLSMVFRLENLPLFILAISLIGGTLAGLAGWSAASLNRLMRQKKR
jgi:hypothetical protein